MNPSSDKQVTVACCQYQPKLADLNANLTLSLNAIKEAVKKGANIVVLPELAQSGYAFMNQAEALSSAEDQNGTTIKAWVKLVNELNIVLIAGFCERSLSAEVFNSAVLIDSSGVRAIYRKAHLWDKEKDIFSEGKQPPPVIATPFGRIGVMICYDLEFPEWVRMIALNEAELLCVPVNWPDSNRPEGERPAEIIRVQANAAVNRIFIAVCDRCGDERGIGWVGGATIVDCDGYPLAGATSRQEAHTIYATLNLSNAHNKSISEHNHVHQDRRLDLYHRMP